MTNYIFKAVDRTTKRRGNRSSVATLSDMLRRSTRKTIGSSGEGVTDNP